MFVSIYMLFALCFGGGYVVAKDNVVSGITSTFTSPVPQAPAAAK